MLTASEPPLTGLFAFFVFFFLLLSPLVGRRALGQSRDSTGQNNFSDCSASCRDAQARPCQEIFLLSSTETCRLLEAATLLPSGHF